MSRLLMAAVAAVAVLLDPRAIDAQRLDPITYRVQIPAPETQLIEVTATVPTDGRRTIDLMMPVWSPGYYRVEDYAAHVRDMAVTAPAGQTLAVERIAGNKWRIETGGASRVQLFYRVYCNQRSVTTNYVDGNYAVLNGAPTFITLAERARRRHDVQLQLPPGWSRAMSGLHAAGAADFRADDYEMLVDSPILAGKLAVHEFVVDGKPHFVVASGDPAGWDATAGVRDLKIFVEENLRFWGELPYDKYLFLVMFRPGGGGLEHRNSNLSTVVARTDARGRWASLGLLAHEFVHLYNVKRLRPVELGPFDFEKAPVTGNLWISEGVTSYYSGLLMTRAGLQSTDDYLASLSSLIGNLQNAPGRLLQSVERSSLEVWDNSNSGVAPAATTVSYYNKGNVLGLLLDARIRRQTLGRRSFDDAMRLAYRRYGGDTGFTSEQFRQTAERVADTDLSEWFRTSVSSTEELDYTDVLEWYGLRFVPSGGKIAGDWRLEVRPDQTDAQKRNLSAWLAPSKH
jgi:predicted metalloprotease with PDZ domain